MQSVFRVWRMMTARGTAGWRLTATLVLGVLVAAVLLAWAPIYARAMSDLGLTFAIRDQLSSSPAVEVSVPALGIASADGRAMQQAIEQRAVQRAGWFTGASSRVTVGPRLLITPEGQPPASAFPPGPHSADELANPSAIAVPETIGAVDQHLRVVDGRLPQPQTGPDGKPVLELTLSSRSATAAGLHPGDRVTLTEYFDDCARELPHEDRPPPPPCTPKTGIHFSLPGQVVGIVDPLDADDAFWAGKAGALFDPFRLIPQAGPLLPALADEQGFAAFFSQLPNYSAAYTWNLYVDPAKLSRDNFRQARQDIPLLRTDMQAVGGFAYSPVENVLDGFGRSLHLQQAPLVILLLQIAAIALFYVAVIAAVVIERRAEEIALLRSRGATRAQVTGLYLFEGLAITLPVVAVAPPLAGLLTALLGRTPTFHRVTGGAPLPVHIGPSAFALAALGAGLALLMLLGPAFVAAGMTGITVRRQAARPGTPWMRRYFLDLAVAGLAALLLVELHERGSVFTPSVAGGVSSDPLLLLSPALLTLAAAALALRFYPLLLRLLAWGAGAAAGVPVVLGLRQVVRGPGEYTRLALLVMMAVAVGTFAASYSSTAERSYRDRAAFETGVDLRAGTNPGTQASAQQLLTDLKGLPGVEQASSVVRGEVTAATPGGGQQPMALLGLDPGVAAKLLWFRSDLADQPLSALMQAISGPPMTGKLLPAGTDAISVWVNPMQARESVTMWARVAGSDGDVAMFELGTLDFTGWRQLRAPLTGRFAPALTPPLAIVSLIFSEPSNVTIIQTPPVYIDDLAAEGPGGTTVIDDFEGASGWQPAPSRAAGGGASNQDQFKIASDQHHGGRSAGQFTFRPGPSTGLRGLYVSDPSIPLPVIVSPDFAAITGAGTGRTAVLASGDLLVPVVVRGVARLFPTIPAGTPFVVANRDQLTAFAGTFTDAALRLPNEVWLGLAPGADHAAIISAMDSSRARFETPLDRVTELQRVNANPLIAAGGSGILVTAFAAVLALVGLALLVTLTGSVQRRRTELAVMRAMGLSRGQVFRLLTFEYALVAVLGVVVGVVLGLQVSRRMLSFLNVTDAGTTVAPPFVLQVNWGMVALSLGALALAFLLAVAVCMTMLERQAAAQSLRHTE